jgi:ribonucleoside-diphosphate reductase alpha chain
VEKIVYRPVRRKLPVEWALDRAQSSRSGGHEGNITAGMYEDGSPGEIFIAMAKEGSTVSGDGHGDQLQSPVRGAAEVRGGQISVTSASFTGNQQILYAKSIMGYIFRWLGSKFLGPEYAVGELGGR